MGDRLRMGFLATLGLLVMAASGGRGAEAPGEAKGVPSRIVRVTVYPEWAYVSREAAVDLARGTARLAFKGLPAWIDAESIRAKLTGSDGARILGVTSKTVYLARSTKEEVRNAEDEVTRLKDQVEDMRGELSALALEKKYLMGLTVWKLDKIPHEAAVREVKLIELREVKDFLRGALADNIKKTKEVERRIRDLGPDLQAKERACAELRGRSRLEQREIVVEVGSDAPARAKLSVSYLVSGASWYPAYDARADAEREKIGVACKAVVQQSTGEDWSGAKFTLSTIQPYLVREKPELKPWYVDSATARQVAGARQRPQRQQAETNQYYRRNAPFGSRLANEPTRSRMKSLQRKQYDYNRLAGGKAAKAQELYQGNVLRAREVIRQVEKRGTSVEFEIAGTYTVPADGKAVKMAVGEVELAAARRYSAAPAVSRSTYVTGAMRNTGEFPFLPGPVEIYVAGSLIGKSKVDTVAEGEKFELYLGLEERIKVTREIDMKKSSTSRSGSSKRLRAGYVIKVQSFLIGAATVEVSDQVPVSQDNRVRVKLMGVEPKTSPPDKGIITWKVALEPGASQELTFEFQMDYPAGVHFAYPAALEEEIERKR